MKLLVKLKRLFGWTDCPACGELVRLRFIHVFIVFPDEPPLLGRWECPSCAWLSPIGHSALMDDAARAHGYKDFTDWTTKNVPEAKENHGTPQ